MKKSSTLIYFVKNFLSPSETATKSFDEPSENYLSTTENAEFSPSARTIKKIIDFARAYDVLETETAGQVEMNLN
jgi:hypothetical protein